MDWEKAVKHYENRLSQALDVHLRALYLAKMPQAEISQKYRNELEDVENPASLQLSRLKRREFRIAVVGLEKAGKSTFVNAWLENDLLPNDNPRCTFSTTQIYSVINDSEQRLEVKAKTSQAFQNMLKELEEKSKGQHDSAKRALRDLETIKNNHETLQAVIDAGDQNIPFDRLEGIESSLKKYVADERYAHAVQEVRLYTGRLAAADGIVFFDVPGIDSGLGKHLEDSEEMLKDCDAVICIQRSNFPSLRAGEQKLIEFVKTGDKEVDLADKLFVFFGSIDAEGTAESFQADINTAKNEWKKYGLNKLERIIPGSAASYLLYKGVAGNKLITNVGNREDVLNRLKRITDSTDSDIEKATGIPVIQEKIEYYLKNERTDVLRKRCEKLIERITKPSRIIYRHVAERYPEDIEEAKKNDEERRIDRLVEWWAKIKWEEIQTELGNYYESLCNGDADAKNVPEVIEKFRDRYVNTIKTEIKNIPSMSEKRREDLFGSMKIEGSDWSLANFRWRERLHIEAIELVEKVARDLSEEILKEYDHLIKKMSDLLWNVDSSRISSKIIKSREELDNRLIHGLRTLFLRFARPIARVLIAAPHDSQRRNEIVKELGPDIELLDPYYEGKEPAYECLKKFVKYGASLLLDHELRKRILGIDMPISELEEKIKNSEYSTKEDMIREVEADLDALEEYLINAVFSAAGFLAYRKQELFNLCQRFRDKEYSWRELLRSEFYSGNTRLLSEVPKECLGKTYDIEVCERLKELRIALNRFDSVRL